jgi:dipicolinate synthase subunit A
LSGKGLDAMLTGRKLVFIGGDARMLEVIQQVTEFDASAVLIGFDKLERQYTDTSIAELSHQALSEADAIVLPVAGMDDDGRVDTKFSDSPIYLTSEHFASIRPGTLVFSGIARPRLSALSAEHRLQLIKLMELDEVAILNSIPTAEGAIALAMQHTDITIHGAKTVVLGFGRCGQTLARTLHALGAHVKVGARQPAHLARVIEMGIEGFPPSALEYAVSDADVVFNTIPTQILTAGVLKTMPRSCVIIDIASKPGGTDFRYAERRGMTAILAPSLPGLVAPKTAGRIIASSLCRILAESTL